MNERQLLEQFRQTPEGQRLLQAIRFAEGTAGPKGYQTMFGGGTFSDLSRHPDTVVASGGYKSAAAGAYQFMPGTWSSYASRLGLGTFGPKEQDIAALALARDKLMKIGGLSALKQEGLSPRVAAALAPAWASFPTESGKSYYGQPVKSLSSIQDVYGRVPAPVADTQTQIQSEAVSPVSIPRFDFKSALKNIVSEFATKTGQPAVVEDQASKYLELANTLDEAGNTDLAEEYRAKALSAAVEPAAPTLDPTALAAQVLQAKIGEKLYNQKAQAIEDQINKSIGAQPASTTALTPAGGMAIPGVQITSAVDTSGEPGFDFVIPGGRGAAFNVPFKAQVLKVVNDPWETNLEKGPGRRGYGNYVDVRGVDPQTGRAFDVRLAHFDKLNPNLKPGSVINPGTFIGTQGRTGSTTGAHVSADFYNPGENRTSPEVMKIGYQIRDRLAKGQPVF
jgi:muramidase (phage lysozyme)/murein DD-endopeptidase MepM/ murein hydrolase activator NlpD